MVLRIRCFLLFPFFKKLAINLIKLEIWYGNNNSKFALIILFYLLFTNVWNTDKSFHHNTLSGKSVINKWWSDIILSAFQYRGVQNLPDRHPGIQHSVNANRQCFSYSNFFPNLLLVQIKNALLSMLMHQVERFPTLDSH